MKCGPTKDLSALFEDFVSGSILILKRFKAITLKDLERLVCGEIIGA
jgi:hypothetical protein